MSGLPTSSSGVPPYDFNARFPADHRQQPADDRALCPGHHRHRADLPHHGDHQLCPGADRHLRHLRGHLGLAHLHRLAAVGLPAAGHGRRLRAGHVCGRRAHPPRPPHHPFGQADDHHGCDDDPGQRHPRPLPRHHAVDAPRQELQHRHHQLSAVWLHAQHHRNGPAGLCAGGHRALPGLRRAQVYQVGPGRACHRCQ